MKKRIFLLSFIFLSLTFLLPIQTNALQVKDISNSIYILDEENMDGIMDDYNQEQTCDGGNSMLGDPNDEESVAWLLQQVLNFIKVVGPLLVVVLSSIDFVKVIVNSDDDAMQKAFKKLGQRLILAALLFFIPTIVEALLDVFGFTSDSTCGLS